jgi:hypothetical protein
MHLVHVRGGVKRIEPRKDAIDIFTNVHGSITADGRRELEVAAQKRDGFNAALQVNGKVRH